MKSRAKQLWASLKINFKTLIAFEVIYRVFGILVIFPIASGLFYLSISLSSYDYITNSVFLIYLFQPTTIIIAFLMAVLLSAYLVVEMVFLSILFHFSHNNKRLPLIDLLYLGVKRVYKVVRRYHIFIFFPAFFFFAAVELAHVSGIATTIELPPVIIDYLFEIRWLLYSVVISLVILYIAFFETIFTFNIFTIDESSILATYKEARSMLKHKRLRIIGDFIVLNSFVNALLYGIYLVLIGVVALLVLALRGQALLLGILLTGLYSIYLFIGFIATIILIPINFAWMSTWYHERKRELPPEMHIPKRPSRIHLSFLKKRWVKRAIAGVVIIVLTLNIITLYSVVSAGRSPIQLFNTPSIIAHRGSSIDAPENTLAAIERAIEDEVDAIEIDVRVTKDGVPVLMHDVTLGRTTNDPDNRRVSDVTYEELLELDAGSWHSDEFAGEKVPTLEEALMLIDNRAEVFIELKVATPNLEEVIIEMVENLKIERNIKILSFNTAQLRTFHRLNEDIETVLLVLTFFGDIDALIRNDFIDHVALEYNLARNNSRYIDRIQQAGKAVYVFTVNDPDDIKEINELDIDGIITDVPIKAREIVYTRTTRSVYANLLQDVFSRD